MPRSLALGLVVAAAFVASSVPAGATPAPAPLPATRAASAVPPNAIGLSLANVAGGGLAVTIDAGASQDADLVVSNHTSDLRLIVKLTATDATGALGAGPASWLAFADDAIQLEPHAATTVGMKVAVPHDTQPGPALAKVTASVESAVAAADGSPRTGTASVTLPVSITVGGSATAQVAIADVHRVDAGATHQLAVVLRNFGTQSTHVDGHIRVGGDRPQTIPLAADLAPARDTTVDVDWNATPVGTPTDLAVDVEYGTGDTATWSSTIGAPPTTLASDDGSDGSDGNAGNVAADTATTIASPDTTTAPSATARKAWWESGLMPVLIVLGLIAAGGWFVFELRSSRRRGTGELPVAPFFMPPPGWAPASSDAAAELAKQLVKLTEIIVTLTTNGDMSRDLPARARSPDPVPAPAATEPVVPRARPVEARAGPSPPADRDPPAPRPTVRAPRSAPDEPGVSARPAPPDDPRAELMRRLVELDHERRRVRLWLDREDAGAQTRGDEP